MRHGFCRVSHLSWLWSCLLQILALITTRGWNARLNRAAAHLKKTLFLRYCSANNPDFAVTYSVCACCVFFVRWRAGAQACLTVIKPLGLHLALSQTQNALPLSFTISLSVSLFVIWVFPSVITHVLSFHLKVLLLSIFYHEATERTKILVHTTLKSNLFVYMALHCINLKYILTIYF